MRDEREMMNLIFEKAYQDENIRVVAMNGSRVNPNITPDIYQDYDIVYVVNDVEVLLKSRSWIDDFGERLIMQTPMDDDPKGQRWFTFLMQFKDGNRIDLMIVPLKDLGDYLGEDKLTKILIDKDGFVPDLPDPSDQDYWTKKPSVHTYHACINEFLWLSPYVVKALKRGHTVYAIEHLNHIRHEFLRMLGWEVAMHHDFKINLGKDYKFLEPLVSTEMWSHLMTTYDMSSYEAIWDALERLILMYEVVCDRVGDALGYAYNRIEFHNVKQAVHTSRNDDL